MRTTLHRVLSSQHGSRRASKLRSIIIQGLSQVLHCTVTKIHTNWPHQLRYQETDLYWVGVWRCIVWREACIIKVASFWNWRHPGIDTDEGWVQTVACVLNKAGLCIQDASRASIDLFMHAYETQSAIMSTHQAAIRFVSQPECLPSQSQCLFIFMSSFAFWCWMVFSYLLIEENKTPRSALVWST